MPFSESEVLATKAVYRMCFRAENERSTSLESIYSQECERLIADIGADEIAQVIKPFKSYATSLKYHRSKNRPKIPHTTDDINIVGIYLSKNKK